MMESVETNTESRRKRPVAVACVACRERKVRCSGDHPCNHCIRRSELCLFDAQDRKVHVSERFLNELKRAASYNEKEQTPRKKPRASAHDVVKEGESYENNGSDESYIPDDSEPPRLSYSQGPLLVSHQEASVENPLNADKSRFCIDKNGKRRFLGPSSTWAYTRQVIFEIGKYVKQPNSPEVPIQFDGNTSKIEWPSTEEAPLTRRDLPSIDHALYLMNTVKFHIAQLYHLYDEPFFTKGLHQFYENDHPYIQSFNLWYVQYLLIMAFGKKFLLQKSPTAHKPGSSYFTRAMRLLPDIRGLYEDPLLSIEVLCGISLYLQCIDDRHSAYVYLGIALRIALTQGLHRKADVEELTDPSGMRSRSIWWTLYILDRKFSSLMGAPVSISDSDVTAILPNAGSSLQKSEALSMHVKISRILTKVLNSVYGIDGRSNKSFVKSVQDVLLNLADLAPNLQTQFDLAIQVSQPISRVAGTLNLCYYQCIILATRPVLVYILFSALANPNSHQSISNPIKALIKECSESAEKSLRILMALKSQDLLDSFLPFDIDCTHSAAFVILVIGIIQPFSVNSGYQKFQLGCVSQIINTMIQQGSIPAQDRYSELQTLQQLLDLLVTRRTQSGAVFPDQAETSELPVQDNFEPNFNQADSPPEVQPHSSYLEDQVGDTGLSSSEMLEIARLLDLGDLFPEDATTNSGESVLGTGVNT